MANVEQHYDQVLSDVYSWMYGGYDAALARYTEFFSSRGIAPKGSGRAVDLGAGCGFQSIPLARLGFAVTAIDIDRKLLDELSEHAGDADIAVMHGDLRAFEQHVHGPVELAVCMVDTLVHLESKADVNATDPHGWTPLHFAAEEVLPQMASLLLAKNADPNLKDDAGNTPLHRAVFSARGRDEVVRLLRKAGAKDDVKNKAGETPRSLADRLGENVFTSN